MNVYERFKNYISAHKNSLIDVVLILIIGLLSITWFKGSFLINVGDQSLPLTPLMDFRTTMYSLWLHLYSLGFPTPGSIATLPYIGFLALFEVLGFSLVVSQKVLYYFIFTMSGLSMYYLAKTVAKRENRRIMGLSSALFYMFNFYPIFLFWRPGTLHSFFYATTPLILGLYIQLLRTKKKLYMVALFFVLTVVFVPIAVNPAYVIILFLILFLYLLFHIHQKRRVRVEILSALKYSIYLLLLWFFLNMWWILPVFPFINESLAGASVVGGTLEIVKLASSQTSFLNIFRLFGPWVFTASIAGEAYFPWGWVYTTTPFLTTGFIPVILAFVPFLMKRKNEMALFFGPLLLSGLFLMKGVHAPLGEIAEGMVMKTTVSALFRSPYDKFGILATLSYAVLVGMGFNVLYSYLEKYRRYIAGATILILSILLFGVYMWPYWTGDIIHSGGEITGSARIRVPDYYYEVGEWMQKQPDEFKICSLPYQEGAAYNWKNGYFGSDDPTLHFLQKPILSSTMFGYKPMRLYLRNLVNLFYSHNTSQTISKILRLTNIRYILIHNDINYQINTLDPEIKAENIKSILDSQKGIHFIKSFGKLDFYKLEDKYFLPHFYIPQNIIYSNGNIEDLLDVMSFGDYKIRSGVYLSGIADDTDEKLMALMERADGVFVKANLKNPVSEKELGEIAPELESVFFPYVRWKPGSFVYPLVLKKEQFDEWRVRDDPKQLFGKKLFYAAKRISEIEKWGLTLDENNWEKTVDRYEQKMKEAVEILERIKIEGKEDLLPLLSKFEASLIAHQKRIENLGLRDEREVRFEQFLNSLKEKRDRIKIKYDSSQLVYEANIPQDGNYQLLIKNEEFNRYFRDAQLKLEFLGEKITVPLLSQNEEGIAGGSFKLEKGKQELKLTKPQTTNLLGYGDWQKNLTKSSFVKDKLVTTSRLQLAFPKESAVYFKPIENYQGDALYKVAFDYFAFGGEAGIALLQDVDIGATEMRLLLQEKLSETSAESPRHFEKIFRSTPGAKTAEFYFWDKAERGEDFKIKLINLKIEKAFDPVIILHAVQHQRPLQMPEITFVKINPIKYRVKVEGAKEPYTLIFSESFHKGWKAYIKEFPISNFQFPNSYGEIVASYFDGEIKEGEHRNTFLEKATFETWGKKPVPEERHLLVNGYANSWYITPEDAGGAENYELIIEFWPQRLFYIGLGISLATLLSCLGYLGFSFAKRKIE